MQTKSARFETNPLYARQAAEYKSVSTILRVVNRDFRPAHQRCHFYRAAPLLAVELLEKKNAL